MPDDDKVMSSCTAPTPIVAVSSAPLMVMTTVDAVPSIEYTVIESLKV